ncbi:ABC transporter ATP-binding protein [soil metagenome]
MTNPVISLENVSKRYKIFPRARGRLIEAASFGKVRRSHDFWALRDISMNVGKGVSLGLLGRNGAGKSTMLQLVAGVLQPTSGAVSTRGRISALLQLGAGFNPEFTGRENAMMNGLLLGIDRREMRRRFEEIEAFADLGEFMDQPVKQYSSGMRSRLGFSVAVNVDPEILLVDEALSVGDGVFRHMGIQKMKDLQSSGATVIFVSHSTVQIKNFCTEAALIHEGRLVSHGPTSETVDFYEALLSSASSDKEGLAEFLRESDEEDPLAAPEFRRDPSLAKRRRHGSGEVEIENVEVLDERRRRAELIAPDTPMTVRVHLGFKEVTGGGILRITLRNQTGLDVYSTTNILEGKPLGRREAGERAIMDFTFRPSLHHGPYSVGAAFSVPPNRNAYLDRIDVAAAFEIDRPKDRHAYGGLAHLPAEVSLFDPDEPEA